MLIESLPVPLLCGEAVSYTHLDVYKRQLVDSADPSKVEQQLREVVAPDKSNDLCHRLVLFGREVCKARKPDCGNCPIAKLCPYEKEAGAPAKKTP